jgi:hypothetical protein
VESEAGVGAEVEMEVMVQVQVVAMARVGWGECVCLSEICRIQHLRFVCRNRSVYSLHHVMQASLIACLSAYGRIIDSFLPMDRFYRFSSTCFFP